MRTQLIINNKTIKDKIKIIRKIVGKKTKIMAVVKADAYGLGVFTLGKVFQKNGIDYFGVALVEEGIELRNNGIKKPILILSEPRPEEITNCIKYNLETVVISKEIIKKINQKNKKVAVHIKVDTGMTRIGCKPNEVMPLIQEIQKLPMIQLKGIMSHLASADSSQKQTKSQLKVFDQIKKEVQKKYKNKIIFHMANSQGTLLYPQAHYDMVRIGIFFYENSVELKTKIVQVKNVPSKTLVSYNGTYKTKKAENLAVIGIGYADGFNRLLSNRGEVLIQGERCPIRGRVCMDLTIVGLSNKIKHKVKKGDEVVLIGKQKGKEITIHEMAQKIGTISYEILCNIGKRVERIYHG
ncbi:alanine racemase [Candidatus Margulisiibacteriota bacterium]